MYKIKFDTEKALWIVQLQSMGFLWKAVVGKEFKTFDEADTWVRAVGIDKVYRNYADSYTAAAFNATPPPYPQVLRSQRA